MWSRVFFGFDVYHLVFAFIIYSMLGWLVESVYMSFCNKKITNRGFGKGPFCPIYGFGAVIGYLVLSPFKGNLVMVYFMGAFLATTFEYIVGRGMIRFLGELWWDYNEKPLNYQGIICLESTIAWGFYAVGIVAFLQGKVIAFIDRFDVRWGIRFIYLVMVVVFIDYAVQLLKVFHVDIKEQKERLVDMYDSFRTRWF